MKVTILCGAFRHCDYESYYPLRCFEGCDHENYYPLGCL